MKLLEIAISAKLEAATHLLQAYQRPESAARHMMVYHALQNTARDQVRTFIHAAEGAFYDSPSVLDGRAKGKLTAVEQAAVEFENEPQVSFMTDDEDSYNEAAALLGKGPDPFLAEYSKLPNNMAALDPKVAAELTTYMASQDMPPETRTFDQPMVLPTDAPKPAQTARTGIGQGPGAVPVQVAKPGHGMGGK